MYEQNLLYLPETSKHDKARVHVVRHLQGGIIPNKRTSTAQQVRDWIAEAPDNSIIDARLAPTGYNNATRVALSHIASDPDSPLEFVRRYIYWKGSVHFWPETGQRVINPPEYLDAALHMAGPGAGFAGYYAGYLLGWSGQIMIMPEIAMLGRPPRGFEDHVLIRSRTNPARLDLTIKEVTFIEAVIGFVQTEGYDIEYKPGHSHLCVSCVGEECDWTWEDALALLSKDLKRNASHLKNLNSEKMHRAVASEPGNNQIKEHLTEALQVLRSYQRALV